jgi:hypothetical protein
VLRRRAEGKSGLGLIAEAAAVCGVDLLGDLYPCWQERVAAEVVFSAV